MEFYPGFPMKAAVLLVRLTKNHALPDGNKRTALAMTIAFCDVNGLTGRGTASGTYYRGNQTE